MFFNPDKDPTMIIGILELVLRLPDSHSLKAKRQVIKSIKDKVRNRFNVSMAEVGDHDLWQTARLGVCTLGNDRAHLNARLDQVLNFIEGLHLASDLEFQLDFLDY